MRDAFLQMFMGMGAIILAPANRLPRPHFRITLPPDNAMQAIGFDFSRVANDLTRSIDKVEHAKQLELKM